VGVGVGVSEECEFQFLTLLMRIASYSSALVHSLREECSERMWQNSKRTFHVYVHLFEEIGFCLLFLMAWTDALMLTGITSLVLTC